MITEILIFIITTLVSYVLYVYKKNHWHFQSQDVKFLPGLPFFGNNIKGVTGRRHFIEDVIEVYNAFPGERYIGYFEGMAPIVLIRDPELIKTITVKDFDHFVDHRHFFADQLFQDSLFQMKASRFALMELKVFLYHMVLNFRVEKCEKTTDTIKLNPDGFNLQALGGSWIKTKARH